MAALKIAHLGHPVLRMPAEPVKRVSVPDIQRPIDDMLETVQEFRQRDLAAPRCTDPSRSSLQSLTQTGVRRGCRKDPSFR